MMQKVDERPLNSRAMKRPLQVRAFPSIPPLELTLLLFLVAAVSSAPSKKERSGPNHFGSLGVNNCRPSLSFLPPGERRQIQKIDRAAESAERKSWVRNKRGRQ